VVKSASYDVFIVFLQALSVGYFLKTFKRYFLKTRPVTNMVTWGSKEFSERVPMTGRQFSTMSKIFFQGPKIFPAPLGPAESY